MIEIISIDVKQDRILIYKKKNNKLFNHLLNKHYLNSKNIKHFFFLYL